MIVFPTEDVPVVGGFDNQSDQPISTVVESNVASVSGSPTGVWGAVVTGDGSPELQVNSEPWTTRTSVVDGDSVKLRLETSVGYATTQTAVLRVNGFRLEWPVTTAAASSLWTPAELGADLALWLDADDASTITLNGSNVSQWSDKSGNSLHLVQSSAAAQPIYLPTGLGASAVVHFDTNTKSLLASTASDWNFLHESGGSAIFLVNQFQPLGTTAPRYLLTTRGSTTGILHAVRDLGTGAYPAGTLFENGQTTLSFSSAPSASTPVDETHIIEWEHGLARTNNFGIYVDGDQKTNVNYTTVPVGGFTADQPLRLGITPMYTGEVVILNALPSTDARQKVEGYLAWKWGGI